MSGLRPWLKERGAGRLLYRWIHRPRQQLALAQSYGWRLAWCAARGDARMRLASRRLVAPATAANPPLAAPVAFLTGRNFVHQTLFCAHSFARATAAPVAFEFLSDGTLTEADAATLRELLPRANVRHLAELDETVHRALPPGKYPVLHAVRKTFVLLRKLTDAMAGRSGYRLLFDSDMIFWREPRELRSRADTGEPLYLADTVDDGYTATRAEITRVLGVPVAAGVNSGLIGLDAGRIDWDLMERTYTFLRSAPGDQRLLEQTLWAVALGALEAHPLEARAYRVVVDPPHWSRVRVEIPPPVLLHYAWHARLPYTAGEWQRYLASCAA